MLNLDPEHAPTIRPHIPPHAQVRSTTRYTELLEGVIWERDAIIRAREADIAAAQEDLRQGKSGALHSCSRPILPHGRMPPSLASAIPRLAPNPRRLCSRSPRSVRISTLRVVRAVPMNDTESENVKNALEAALSMGMGDEDESFSRPKPPGKLSRGKTFSLKRTNGGKNLRRLNTKAKATVAVTAVYDQKELEAQERERAAMAEAAAQARQHCMPNRIQAHPPPPSSADT